MPTSLCLSAAPGTGKTAIGKFLDELLKGFNGHNGLTTKPFVRIDNEWAFSKEMRALCAEESGMVLNSPDFIRAFNLRGQLDFQALVRNIGRQGFNVIMPGPFEDLTPLVGGVPLLHKMKADFEGFDLRVVQLVLVPEGVTLTSENILGNPAMRPIEEEIQRRLAIRGADNEYQRLLDADKHGENYYSERLRKQFLTFEAFPTEVVQVRTFLGEDIATVANKVATAILS